MELLAILIRPVLMLLPVIALVLLVLLFSRLKEISKNTRVHAERTEETNKLLRSLLGLEAESARVRDVKMDETIRQLSGFVQGAGREAQRGK